MSAWLNEWERSAIIIPEDKALVTPWRELPDMRQLTYPETLEATITGVHLTQLGLTHSTQEGPPTIIVVIINSDCFVVYHMPSARIFAEGMVHIANLIELAGMMPYADVAKIGAANFFDFVRIAKDLVGRTFYLNCKAQPAGTDGPGTRTTNEWSKVT